ncbi:MAG: four-carbon acid sugar kinase family protein [Lachnospiraceae bacterium]|nr:four-carbon acid sugar kinase family protein [Lachnospiraceae bacterium]
MKLLILADDLTGALDTAVYFAECGASVLIRTAADPEQTAQVLCIDMESRHLRAEEARSRALQLTKAAVSEGFTHVYKKTDSVLRGNHGAEIAGVLQGLGAEQIQVVQGHPRLGRTVKNGILLVDGVPVSQSAFSKDPFNPVCCDGVEEILVRTAPDLRGRVMIYDSETELDLDAAYELIRERGMLHCLAGCGGFAKVLARKLSGTGNPVCFPKYRNMLLICGSMHVSSREQLITARKAGFPFHEVACGLTGEDFQPVAEGISPASVVERISSELKSEPVVMVGTPVTEHPAEQEKHNMEAMLGEIVSAVLEQQRPDVLCVFGGDTLHAVLQKLGVSEIRPEREILPGVIQSSFRYHGKPMELISKAGSFGGRETVTDLRRLLLEQ